LPLPLPGFRERHGAPWWLGAFGLGGESFVLPPVSLTAHPSPHSKGGHSGAQRRRTCVFAPVSPKLEHTLVSSRFRLDERDMGRYNCEPGGSQMASPANRFHGFQPWGCEVIIQSGSVQGVLTSKPEYETPPGHRHTRQKRAGRRNTRVRRRFTIGTGRTSSPGLKKI
jgi:hypothetical protein